MSNGKFDPERVFRKELKKIDTDLQEHMKVNVGLYYKKLPNEVDRMKPSQIKKAFITIVYLNMKNEQD